MRCGKSRTAAGRSIPPTPIPGDEHPASCLYHGAAGIAWALGELDSGRIDRQLVEALETRILAEPDAPDWAAAGVWLAMHPRLDRSMGFTKLGDDSECSVVAVSTGTLVPNLRVRSWAEHLRVPTVGAEADEIRDLNLSLGLWRPTWGMGVNFDHPDSQLVLVGP